MAISTQLPTLRTDASRRSLTCRCPTNHRRATAAQQVSDRLEALTRSDGSLGGVDLEEILDHGRKLLDAASPALGVAVDVLADPYLPEVVCHVERLARIEQGEPPGRGCTPTRAVRGTARRGIGLRLAAKPLRAVVWARLHPALATALAISVVGAVFGIGVAFGQRTRP